MGVLDWNKPERAMPVEQWQAISADGAPPGVWTPNMSDQDRERWKAKLVGVRKGEPQVEIRKSTPGGQMVIIVGLRAYTFKHYSPDARGYANTQGKNLHISHSGPAIMTFADFEQLAQAVAEARQVLELISAGAISKDAITQAAGNQSNIGQPKADLSHSVAELFAEAEYERVRIRLLHKGITTVGRLVQQTPKDLLAITGFGQKSLDQVLSKLAGMGLQLAKDTY
jgi:hypothetical protein